MNGRIEYHVFTIVEWAPCSPDMRRIEHIRAEIFLMTILYLYEALTMVV